MYNNNDTKNNPLFGFYKDQTEENPTNQRKRCSWVKMEADFQKAQDDYEAALASGDKEAEKDAWDRIFYHVQHVSFNLVNKRLSSKNVVLPHDTVEERAMDVALSVLQTMQNKRLAGKDWRIGKLSSYVWLPSLRIYNPDLVFWDRLASLDQLINPDDELNSGDMGCLISSDDFAYREGVWYSDVISEIKMESDEGDYNDEWN